MSSEVKRAAASPPSSFLRRVSGWGQSAHALAAEKQSPSQRVFPLTPASPPASSAPATPADDSHMFWLTRTPSKLVKRRSSARLPHDAAPSSPPSSSARAVEAAKAANSAITRSGSVSGISSEGYRSSDILPLTTTLSRSATLPSRVQSNASTSGSPRLAPTPGPSTSASTSTSASATSTAPQTPLNATPFDTPLSLPTLLRNSSSSSSTRESDEIETPQMSSGIPPIGLSSGTSPSFTQGEDSALLGWTVVDAALNKIATRTLVDSELDAYERPRPRFAERPMTPNSVVAPSESSTSTVKARLNLQVATTSSVIDLASPGPAVEPESSNTGSSSLLFGISMRGRQGAKHAASPASLASSSRVASEDADSGTVKAERPKLERSSSVKRLFRSLSKKRTPKERERVDRVFPVPPSAPAVPPIPHVALASHNFASQPLGPAFQPNLPTISSSPDPGNPWARAGTGTMSGAFTVPNTPRTVTIELPGEKPSAASPSFIPRRTLSLRRSNTSPSARLLAQRQSFTLPIEQRPVALAATRRSTLYDIEDDNDFALALKELETASPEFTPEDFTRANHTVRDFIVTERAYASKLERGVKIIEAPAGRRKSQHDTPDMAMLTESLPRLFRLSMALVTLFEKQPTIEGLANAFISLEDELLSEYGQWCQNVGEVIVAGTAQAFSDDLSDIIITPVQRATRYELLFKTILRGLPTDTFLHIQVTEAVAAAHRLARECDRRQATDLDDLRRDSVDRYRRTRSRPLSLAGKPRLPVW
ncbi:hypothetical protein Q5752_000716 [Cryptotrichosporon argae]